MNTPDTGSTSSGRALIEPQINGPLKVENPPIITNSRNETVEADSTVYLCRCGGSRSKPFCDDSHKTLGFSSEKCDSRVPDRRDSYRGTLITIHDNRGICSHAGFCTSLLPAVFGRTEPWIDPDAETVERIIEIIRKCPSGALSYTLEEREYNTYYDRPEIHIDRNGPYQVRGLANPDSPGDHSTLCRCGNSCNKPQCDGSHWYADFKDDEGLTISAANRSSGKGEAEWVKVLEAGAPGDGERAVVPVAGRSILITRVKGIPGAVEGVCSHQKGPLSEGKLEGETIRCPWHGHSFDRVSGKSLNKDHDIESFPIEERKDGIYVKAGPSNRSGWTVSHVMMETMANWGIDTVFGMVGHSNLGVAEALRVLESRGSIRFIGVRHEGAAAFAASGYAKASGRPAACLSIAGPGATNLLTGLWDAKVDRIPVLAITGQVKSQFLAPGYFQEIDLSAAFEPVSGFSRMVLPSSDHPGLMSMAIKHAVVERETAHLIFPDEVQTIDAGTEAPAYPEGRTGTTGISAPPEAVEEAGYRIARSMRPVIIVGYGARESMRSIIRLAERLNAPVLTTFKGKGQISDRHPLGAGVLGRSGTPVASSLMNSSDLLIVFGASFSQHTGIDANKPIIQIDFDRRALGKFHTVSTPVWGACDTTAEALLSTVPDGYGRKGSREELHELWQAWEEEKAVRAALDKGKGMASAKLFEILSSLIPEEAVIAVDVGNNTYSYGRYFVSTGQRTIMSGYLGSIGFAFPAAMGARMALPERPTISISGDGGFGQYMNEFLTAVKYGMHITHFLLNNGELGKISKEQRSGGWEVWKTGLANPSFAEFAQICGGMGIRVTDEGELAGAAAEALAYKGPAIVEIMCDPELI
jgi:thiamine pyrophosphate-dependent acetolactate synthase large subunit-like protein/CDGSH-type Zn-finger protein/nitrite reductase/ring-hydroxylating ferredoxin subunit